MYIFWIHPGTLASFWILWKVSGYSGKFLDALESFWIPWKVSGYSGKFPDAWKVSGCYVEFPVMLQSFWILWKVWKVSGYSGNFLVSLKSAWIDTGGHGKCLDTLESLETGKFPYTLESFS
jgi:hypothetical protein